MHLATEVDTVRTCKDRNAGPVAKYSKTRPDVRWLGFPREFRQAAGCCLLAQTTHNFSNGTQTEPKPHCGSKGANRTNCSDTVSCHSRAI